MQGAAPENPKGYISVEAAFDRFRKAKWPGDGPYAKLREWIALPASRKPNEAIAALLGSKGELATIAGLRRMAQKLGSEPDTKEAVKWHRALRRLVRWGRFELPDRIERQVELVWQCEYEEFIAAFATGDLAAVGAVENEVERERWSGLRVFVRGVWDDVEVTFPYDWSRIFVRETAFDRWIEPYASVTPPASASRSQVRRLLDIFSAVGAVSEVEAEGLAAQWLVAEMDSPARSANPTDTRTNRAAGGKDAKPRKDAEKNCAAWLMAEHSREDLGAADTQSNLWPKAETKFAPYLTHNGFLRAWGMVAAQRMGWSGGTPPSRAKKALAGTPRSNPQQ